MTIVIVHSLEESENGEKEGEKREKRAWTNLISFVGMHSFWPRCKHTKPSISDIQHRKG